MASQEDFRQLMNLKKLIPPLEINQCRDQHRDGLRIDVDMLAENALLQRHYI